MAGFFGGGRHLVADCEQRCVRLDAGERGARGYFRFRTTCSTRRRHCQAKTYDVKPDEPLGALGRTTARLNSGI